MIDNAWASGSSECAYIETKELEPEEWWSDTVKSEKTFEPEVRLLRREVPDAFWKNERDYPHSREPGRHVLAGLSDQDGGDFEFDFWHPKSGTVRATDQRMIYLDGAGQWQDRSTTGVHRISRAAKDENEFAQAFWLHFGVDIEALLDEYFPNQLAKPSDANFALAELVQHLGMEAFGAYLPFHAFYNSNKTPWGMYIFPEKLIIAAKVMHNAGIHLGADNASCLTVFRRLWWMVYRHELFHFHVERFATKFEIADRKPIFRPYVEKVRTIVEGTDEWLEEALAQAVLRNSRLLQRALGMKRYEMEELLVPFLETFPPGYRNYQGKPHKSAAEAHEYFAAQIRLTEKTHSRPHTTMVTPLREYIEDPESVPGYLVFRVDTFPLRFQLATPRMDEVERYCRREGFKVDEGAPGDHKRVVANKKKLQLNFAKGSKEIDLASIKALARHQEMSVQQLISAIKRR